MNRYILNYCDLDLLPTDPKFYNCGFCTGHFVMVPLNMTCLHGLQHSLFVHLFHLFYALGDCDLDL